MTSARGESRSAEPVLVRQPGFRKTVGGRYSISHAFPVGERVPTFSRNGTRMIRTIFFDMGNVLLPFSHPKMCAQLAEECGRSPEEIRRFLFDDGWQGEFERGALTEEEFAKKLREYSGRDFSLDAFRRAEADIFTEDLAMCRLTRHLGEIGLPLILLSNTCCTHFEFVKNRYPVLDPFDGFVLSYEVGALKPEPTIFKAALSVVDYPPEECFYTDDIAAYVEVGRQFGLQTTQFTGAEPLVAELRRRGLFIPDDVLAGAK